MPNILLSGLKGTVALVDPRTKEPTGQFIKLSGAGNLGDCSTVVLLDYLAGEYINNVTVQYDTFGIRTLELTTNTGQNIIKGGSTSPTVRR